MISHENQKPLIELQKVSKSFSDQKVLQDISFNVFKGEFVSIFGPNGCGKSTILNLIAGLEKPDYGDVKVNYGDESFKYSYIFQNYKETLFPWKTVLDNIALPLKIRGIGKNESNDRVQEIVKKFSIDIPLEKYPYQLSGGQQQIIAILRSFIQQPDLILMDEPFSSLDFQKKLFFYEKVLEIWNEINSTIIFISHDIDEAIYLADTAILIGNAPTNVLTSEEINLHRPRQIEMLTDPDFTTIKGKLLKLFLNAIPSN